MTDKDLVLDGHAFADEGVTRDLDVASDFSIPLDFHKRADLCIVADVATVEVDESMNLNIHAQLDVRCDSAKFHCCPLALLRRYDCQALRAWCLGQRRFAEFDLPAILLD